jgi:carbon storage regulator CsrA
MLVLTRSNDESVIIDVAGGYGRVLKLTVLDSRRGRVKLGFEADSSFQIDRLEVWQRIRADEPLGRAASCR